MITFVPSELKKKVSEWRQNNYSSEFPAISEILGFAFQETDPGLRTPRFLRMAQIEALETYWYLRLVEKTPRTIDIMKKLYGDGTDLLTALEVPLEKEIIDLMLSVGLDGLLKKIVEDDTLVKRYRLENVRETLSLVYPSYIFALAMGAGKTYLIGAIVATEFAMAIEYPNQGFVENALVFAPGKTILGALKEMSNIPFEKILPEGLYKPFMNSVKITYTQDGPKDIQVQPRSIFNLVITNSEKIRIQKPTGTKKITLMNFRQKEKLEEQTEIANLRLQKIASLPHLAIFSDEAHHTYGRILEKELKKIRKTVDYLAENTNVIVVVNTTGTPYYQRKMLKDVVFWYSLSEGIRDGILKEVKDNIVSFEDVTLEKFVTFVVQDFYKHYRDVRIYNNSKAKLAIYFPQTSDLISIKPAIEKQLMNIGEDPSVVLEVHNKSRDDIKDYFNNRVNEPSNPYRIFLLVNMGTEGWNCPSLFATALARKLSGANNFVLQAASRCLRQTVDNKNKAKIYLAKENVSVLDRQLQETYGETLTTIYKTAGEMVRRQVVLRKIDLPTISIKKKITRIVSLPVDASRIELKVPTIESVSPVAIRFEIKEGEKKLLKAVDKEEVILNDEAQDLYQVAIELCSVYRLNPMEIMTKLKTIYPDNEVPTNHILDLKKQIESQTKVYHRQEEEIEIALAIVRPEGFSKEYMNGNIVYTTEIMYHKDKEHLLVSIDETDPAKFGFHCNPYKFDSNPEKDFFKQILDALKLDPDEIEDIYYIGSFTDYKKTEFLFEYSDVKGKWHTYTPDFLIRKKDGRILIVEVKAERFRDERKDMVLEQIKDLNPQQIKYEILLTSSEEIGLDNLIKTKEWIYNG